MTTTPQPDICDFPDCSIPAAWFGQGGMKYCLEHAKPAPPGKKVPGLGAWPDPDVLSGFKFKEKRKR